MKSIRCRLDWHSFEWINPDDATDLWWRECSRCGCVNTNDFDDYFRYKIRMSSIEPYE